MPLSKLQHSWEMWRSLESPQELRRQGHISLSESHIRDREIEDRNEGDGGNLGASLRVSPCNSLAWNARSQFPPTPTKSESVSSRDPPQMVHMCVKMWDTLLSGAPYPRTRSLLFVISNKELEFAHLSYLSVCVTEKKLEAEMCAVGGGVFFFSSPFFQHLAVEIAFPFQCCFKR